LNISKSEKLKTVCVPFRVIWKAAGVIGVYAHLIHFLPKGEGRKACRIQVELRRAIWKQAIQPLRSPLSVI
jgi:HJR/Mrr/RecB family endonuclease